MVVSCAESPHSEEVSIDWSPELDRREGVFGRSLLMTWTGIREVDWSEVGRALKSEWSDSEGLALWPLGPRMAFLRLPRESCRETILCKASMSLPFGSIRFSPCDNGVGALNGGGMRVDAFLKGIPLLWRTRDSIRRIVGVFGHLVDMSEVIQNDEEILVVKVGVWMNIGQMMPPEIVLRLDGWRVVVKVEVVGAGVSSTYADVLRNVRSSGGAYSSNMKEKSCAGLIFGGLARAVQEEGMDSRIQAQGRCPIQDSASADSVDSGDSGMPRPGLGFRVLSSVRTEGGVPGPGQEPALSATAERKESSTESVPRGGRRSLSFKRSCRVGVRRGSRGVVRRGGDMSAVLTQPSHRSSSDLFRVGGEEAEVDESVSGGFVGGEATVRRQVSDPGPCLVDRQERELGPQSVSLGAGSGLGVWAFPGRFLPTQLGFNFLAGPQADYGPNSMRPSLVNDLRSISRSSSPGLSPDAISGGSWYNRVEESGKERWCWSPHCERRDNSACSSVISSGRDGISPALFEISGRPSEGLRGKRVRPPGKLKSIIVGSLDKPCEAPMAEVVLSDSHELSKRRSDDKFCRLLVSSTQGVQGSVGIGTVGFPTGEDHRCCGEQGRFFPARMSNVEVRKGSVDLVGARAERNDSGALAAKFSGSPACRKGDKVGFQLQEGSYRGRFKDFVSEDMFDSARVVESEEEV
ncbi:hypothetical protein QJS04_geneDACA019280 [Acorus gramineus]|uniref:DUF4283 domain-containing protein n=1 Tax=Acorus gramineus TaxID=55184 RepID=A0AAV9A3E1_ACOGR|nr:hypothetical protein QJS04_geneDACA019280 [Acorus gramineus]